MKFVSKKQRKWVFFGTKLKLATFLPFYLCSLWLAFLPFIACLFCVFHCVLVYLSLPAQYLFLTIPYLPQYLFLTVTVPFLAYFRTLPCLLLLLYLSLPTFVPFLAYFCIFPCLLLYLPLPAFVPFLACHHCAFPCLSLYLSFPEFVSFVACP